MTENDVINFYSAITGDFQGAVQYNNGNQAFLKKYETLIFLIHFFHELGDLKEKSILL